MKNLEILKEIVDVKYNDMQGLVAFDNNDMDNIHSLCKSNGIDIDNHFLLGFGFSFGEMRGDDRLKTILCEVLLLDKKYGTMYENVVNNLKNDSAAKVFKKRFYMPVEELGRYIKRFDSMAVGEISSHINRIEIAED